MIAATSSAEAIAAGVAALDDGGNAVDAALTASMVQIVRAAGSWNSFAGILGMVVYDAETGEVASLHGNYRTFAGEVDPATIPASGPSGRTALVPGFMAAATEAHARYGLLPFERVMNPAIELAEGGFEVDALLASYFVWRGDVLRRRPETLALFTDASGAFLEEGDLLRQPELARTLRAVVEEGAAYMYEGDWAEAFVAAVQEEGGAVSADDLSTYAPDWLEPLEGRYAGATVYTLGTREFGGVQVLEGLHMAEALELDDWTRSGAELHALAEITQVNQVWTWLYDYYPEYQPYVAEAFPDISLDHAARIDPLQGARMADHVETGRWAEFAASIGLRERRATHSDAVVVVDASGNAVALTHTINTTIWGETGIFVGGVSIPDSASFQQALLLQVPPGEPVPTPLNPLIAVQDGGVALAASTIGNVHYAQLQRTVAILELGRSPAEAVAMPMLDGLPFAEKVLPNDFPAEVLEEARALGTPIEESGESSFPGWVGVAHRDGALSGATEAWMADIHGGVGRTTE